MPLADIEALLSGSSNENDSADCDSFLWSSAGLSHAGRVRPVNEDAFIESCDHRLWCVSDGMGGLSRGDYASKTVTQELKTFKQLATPLASLAEVKQRLDTAHATCRQAFRGQTLGATAAVLLAAGKNCYAIWAGDSRIYRLRSGNLTQLTTDHTLEQAMLDGELKFDSAEPSSHVLTRAVGIHRQLKLSVNVEPVQRGDRYLLCSDGLYNPLSSEKLQSLLATNNHSEAIEQLIRAGLDAGAPDNLTGILVDVG